MNVLQQLSPIPFPGLSPQYATWERFNWPLISVYILLHFSLLLAVPTYTPEGLGLFLGLYFLTTCCGITLCYHRLLAHRSYQTYKPIRWFLSLLGVLAFQRGPIWWVATHRLHHSQVDTPLDPHTPQVSFLWSHFLWAFFRHPQLDETPETTIRLARDIADDPVMRFLERYYTALNIGFLIVLAVVGYYSGGERLAVSFFVWGGLLRLLYTLHVTWCVNSAAHVWGYRSYQTDDTSKNNWWVALLTYGEGWHNNHHADQRAARNGHRWYEIDVTYYIIVLMARLGMARHVAPVSERLKKIAL